MSKVNLYILMGKEPDLQGLLKDRFEYLEEEPDVDLWTAIDERISKKPGLWSSWRPYAAIAAAIALLFTIWALNLSAPSDNSTIAEQPTKPEMELGPAPYKQELASLNPPSIEKEKESGSPGNQLKKKTKVYIPPKRSTTPLTIPQVESNLMATETLEERKERNKVKSLDWKKSQPEQLAQVNPVTKDAIIPQAKPLAVSQNNSIQQLSPNMTEINLNEMTLKDAVSFATDQINKRKGSVPLPLKIEEEETKFGTKKTYEFQILNVTFSRKTYRPNKKTK